MLDINSRQNQQLVNRDTNYQQICDAIQARNFTID